MPAQVRKSLLVKSSPEISLQVGVDVGGLDAPRLAVLVDVLEELLAGQVLHAAHDAREAAIGELDRVLDAALAAKAEPRALEPRTRTCRSRSVVRPNDSFSRAYSSLPMRTQRRLEQAHHGRQHLLARQARAREVARAPGARMRGSARGERGPARPYFVSSRTSRQRG